MRILALLLLLPSLAVADPLLRHCGDPTAEGKSSVNWVNCSPSNMTWERPDRNLLTPMRLTENGSSVWTRALNIQPEQWVIVCDQPDVLVGNTSSCYQKTKRVLASSLNWGGQPEPDPPEPPTGTEFTDSGALTWTLDATDPLRGSLTGFRIEYGLGDAFDQRVVVGSVTSHTIANLTAGTWKFRVVALAGTLESGPSPVATKVIAPPPPPPEWFVAPVSGDSRPAYEAVLNAAGNALVRGNTEGRIPVGKPCGAEAFRVSANSYRDVNESDVSLGSPTYRGRRHVALCVRR